MIPPITARGQALLDDLPPFLADDPLVQRIVDTMARELVRLDETALAIQRGALPAAADDTFGLLSLWETLVNLPVAPVGVSVAERRAKVVAFLRRRDSGSGLNWIAVISEVVNRQPWTHIEGPGAYQVTIRIPYQVGGYTPGVVATLARSVTPAHLDLLVGYNEGFLVGISQIGIDVL